MLSFLVLTVLLPLAQSGGPLFGPETPLSVFKGQVTQNGKPVPALLSLEVLYKLNGNLVPLSLVQVNSLPNYQIQLNGLVLKNENLTNTAILRAQALDINGGSSAIKLHLKDGKLLYEQNIELNSRRQEEEDLENNNLNLDQLLRNIPIHGHHQNGHQLQSRSKQLQDLKQERQSGLHSLGRLPQLNGVQIEEEDEEEEYHETVEVHHHDYPLREGGEEDLIRFQNRPLIGGGKHDLIQHRPHLIGGKHDFVHLRRPRRNVHVQGHEEHESEDVHEVVSARRPPPPPHVSIHEHEEHEDVSEDTKISRRYRRGVHVEEKEEHESEDVHEVTGVRRPPPKVHVGLEETEDVQDEEVYKHEVIGVRRN